MKKTISIRALLIALMLTLTFAIPAAPAASQPSLIEAAQAVSAETAAEIASSYTATPVSVLQDTADESSAVEDDAGTVAEEVIEKAVKDTSDEAIDAVNDAAGDDTACPQCDYCGSQSHSYAYCAQRSVDNGAVGRWVIPSVGINVACYYDSWLNSSPEDDAQNLDISQAIVDAWDSALYRCHSSNAIYMQDHSNQEFGALKYVNVGDVAYMDFGSYRQKYICADYQYGTQVDDGNRCYSYDANGNWLESPNPTFEGIICKTCNGSWSSILLIFFQPVYD